MNSCSFCEWIPILPWPVCPLAGHARLGQNTVVGSMTILLSWLCWGACQEEVCLDPRCPVQPHSTTVSCGATRCSEGVDNPTCPGFVVPCREWRGTFAA